MDISNFNYVQFIFWNFFRVVLADCYSRIIGEINLERVTQTIKFCIRFLNHNLGKIINCSNLKICNFIYYIYVYCYLLVLNCLLTLIVSKNFSTSSSKMVHLIFPLESSRSKLNNLPEFVPYVRIFVFEITLALKIILE